MTVSFGQRLRNAAVLSLSLITAEAQNSAVRASDAVLTLVPVTLAQAMPGKYYVTEGIVVVVLFAAALFAVCRSSSRS